MRTIIPIFIITITFFSCSTVQQPAYDTSTFKLEGNWEYLGYGKSIMINDSMTIRHDLSTVGNVYRSKNSRTDFEAYYKIEPLAPDTFVLRDGVKAFKLYRTGMDYSADVKEDLSDDPKHNFEVLWNTINEQYCYFKERNIDWQSVYDKYASQVVPSISELELFKLFENMLDELNDGHVSIDLPESLEDVYEVSVAEESDNKLEKKLSQQYHKNFTEKYIDNPQYYNRNTVTWGNINDDVAYIHVMDMIGFAHYDIPFKYPEQDTTFWDEWWTQLSAADNYHDDTGAGAKYILDSIMMQIKDAKACILDLRFNGGGFDDASHEFLHHFARENKEFAKKKARLGDGFANGMSLYLKPSDNAFQGKLYILTSFMTASAAELVVLGSKELPDVTIVGGTTEGVFSDILGKRLPNGWRYGISNEIYESLDGVNYENVGLKADIDLGYPRESIALYQTLNDQLDNGDSAIEAVMQDLKSNN